MSHSIVIRIVNVSLRFISLDLEEGGGGLFRVITDWVLVLKIHQSYGIFSVDPISSKLYIFIMIACI